PDACEWRPGKLPTPSLFDRWNPQRFTMLDGDFSFSEGDSFRGYGVGCTYPITVDGAPRLLAAVVGNLMEGEGKFRGREGSFVMTGTVTSSLGFLGQISLRVLDPDGVLRTERELP